MFNTEDGVAWEFPPHTQFPSYVIFPTPRPSALSPIIIVISKTMILYETLNLQSSQKSPRGQQQTSFHQQSTSSQQQSTSSQQQSVAPHQQSTTSQSTTSHGATHSTILTEMEAESFHKTVHVESSERRSTSHAMGIQHQTPNTQESAKDIDTKEEEKKADPNVWSVLNSVDDESVVMFGLPPERSAKEKQADSVQLVMELIDKVNAQQSDFVTADSKALNKIHTELIKVSQLVRNFLEYSTNLINDEGRSVI